MIQFSPDKSRAQVEYVVNEGKRVYVQKLTFSGIPKIDQDDLISKLTNRPGLAFNPISFTEDIRKVAVYFQERGYYFAEVSNTNNDSLVVYDKNGEGVNLNYALNAGRFSKTKPCDFSWKSKNKKKSFGKACSA